MTLYYAPIFELIRGKTIESIHHGCVAVVDVYGNLLAWYGDPDTVTFLRSTAKPFQALPFVERGGVQTYQLSMKELAILCASHSGTDEHVATVRGIQAKVGVSETELLCGVHDPGDQSTMEAMRQRNEKPTPVRHNCSGKHTGMLAFVRLSGVANHDLVYIDPQHPIQREILNTVSQMCELPVTQIEIGIDGCSAPNFAMPLRNAALAFARLCDPLASGVKPAGRVEACQMITMAMASHPAMVGGPGSFDTRLMQVGQRKIVAKGGAEGYQGIGLLPGVLGPEAPGVGIAVKIADGDARNRVRAAVVIEVLRQLGALSQGQLEELADIGPHYPVYNWRKIHVGQAQPTFTLQRL